MVDRAAKKVQAGRRLVKATCLSGVLFLAALFVLTPPRLPWVPAAAAADGPVVTMNGGVQPAQVTVTIGTTVTWEGTDGQKHRIRSTSGPAEFDSGGLNPGQSYTYTFTGLGTYGYVDDQHKNDPGSAGTVVVATSVPPGGGGGGGGGGGAASGTVSASIADRAFSPGSFSVTAGTTIVWTNNDKEAHTVTARSGGFDSGNIGVGSTYRHTFDAVGSFQFVCTIHPSMVGVVAVSAAGAPAPPPPPPPTAPPTTAPPPPPAAGSNTIQIIDYAFRPATITISPNTTLTWSNVGQAVHTVSASDGSFGSGNVKVNGQFTHTFTQSGTFTYICDIHPDMTATVSVTGANGAPPPPAATTTTVAVPAAPATGGVRIVDFAFEPTSITVAQGGAVTFVNAGVAKHTVTANDGSFDSGLLARGAVFRKEFTAAGTFTYVCQLHPQMTGTILVTGASGEAPPPAAPTTTRPARPPAQGDVKMLDFSFSPSQISVVEGGSVTFANGGQAPHTVTAKDGSFDSGFVQPGGTYRRTFATAGTFLFFCNIHPQMTGTVLVTGAAGEAPPPPAPEVTKTAPPPATGDVRMVDFGFAPTQISVVVGGKVSFANAGQAPHTVTARDASFDSGMVKPGETYEHTFAAAGTFNYYCDLHPQMTGTALVTGANGEAPPPAAAEAESSGPPPLVLTANVKVKDTSYQPSAVTVALGGTVRWTIDSEAPRYITADDASFDSGLLSHGRTFSYTFKVAGSYGYHDRLVNGMAGSVNVIDPATANTKGAAADGRSAGVAIVDNDFDPKSVTVKAGGTVSWTNTGKAKHTVSAKDNAWTSDLLPFGGRYQHTFDTPGTFEYICTLHPNMVGTVVVTNAAGDAPPAALVAAKGAKAKASGGRVGLGFLEAGTVIVAIVIGAVLASFVVFARTFRPGSGLDEVDGEPGAGDDPDDAGRDGLDGGPDDEAGIDPRAVPVGSSA